MLFKEIDIKMGSFQILIVYNIFLVQDIRKAVTDLQLELSVMQQETASMRADIITQEKALHDDEVATDRLDLEMLTRQV